MSSQSWTLAVLAILVLLWPTSRVLAAPLELEGRWYRAPDSARAEPTAELDLRALTPVAALARTGGRYVFVADFEVPEPNTYVLDFKNSSTIGLFHHLVFAADGALIASLEGGIESRRDNPYMLRHGRELVLGAGTFRLISWVSSPFFLARPAHFIDARDPYRQSIKLGNVLVLLCLGILLGLGLYYTALAVLRRRVADGMYATFLLGNLLYNGTALLLYPDVFGMHWFYLVSVPILFSNIAYVAFVIALLELSPESHPQLFRAGAVLIMLFVAFIGLAALFPHWSLELDRYGVGMFASYGVVAGTICAREGNPIARAYLVAVASLFVLAMVSITIHGLQTYTIYVEHVGLLAVTVELILLAVVLARRG
ncbi:MAG: domain sensor diguanylate cyclase [Myxococcaceae bacterium]|nr:domain sensor diguanylate cyclase [Myxococcaceae bacterium]